EGKPNDHLFPGLRGGPLNRNTMNMFMVQALGISRDNATPHGFRTSCRSWAKKEKAKDGSGRPRWPRWLLEMLLTHKFKDKTEEAYDRDEDDDCLEERREVMNAWGAYLDGETSGNVLPFERKAG